MRQALKHGVEHLAGWSGVMALGRWRLRGRTLVLAYHNIIPDGVAPFGDRSLHLPRADFASQLEALEHTHEIVPLGQALTPRPAGRRPRAAITFDDAYQGAIAAGVEELVKRELPATIFVAPALVGGASLWWDALADPATGLAPALRDRALDEWSGANDEALQGAESAGAKVADVPPVARVAAEADILAAAQHSGISLGSHAWSHSNLTRLTREQVAQELARSLAWLSERTRAAPAWLAYPYGLFDSAVAAEAERAGYEGALGISGGWVPRAVADRFALPRVNIPAGISLGGFRLRGAGFLCD